MLIGKVVGTLVATRKVETMEGVKFLVGTEKESTCLLFVNLQDGDPGGLEVPGGQAGGH